MNLWTIPTVAPKQYLMLGFDSPFQDITQNPNFHKPLQARESWLLHHWPETFVSMGNFPSWFETLQKSHLIVPRSTAQISPTSAIKWDFSLYFWSNANCLSNSFPCDSVELCETEVCVLHIQLIRTNVWLPKMHNVPPEVDFESPRSPAKSESWNSPNLHCLAVFPTWQYCL